MKNILKRSILIGLGYYFLVLINACCNCKEPRHYLFGLDNIVAKPISYTIDGDTNFSYSTILKDSVEHHSFGLLLSFEGKKVVLDKTHQNPIINTAIACKCIEEYYTSLDTIAYINIASLLDFDASKTAGSDVTEYFNYLAIKYEPKRIERLSIMEVVFNLNDYFSYSPSIEPIPVQLIKMPENIERKMKFAITVGFRNGKILKDTTAIINY